MVEIVEKRVERAHPLLDPALELAPLPRGNDPRDHVERDQPFFGIVLAIDVEGDPGAAKSPLGLARLAPQDRGILLPVPVAIIGIGGLDATFGIVHFVVGRQRRFQVMVPMCAQSALHVRIVKRRGGVRRNFRSVGADTM